jgi:hypothetical protein
VCLRHERETKSLAWEELCRFALVQILWALPVADEEANRLARVVAGVVQAKEAADVPAID